RSATEVARGLVMIEAVEERNPLIEIALRLGIGGRDREAVAAEVRIRLLRGRRKGLVARVLRHRVAAERGHRGGRGQRGEEAERDPGGCVVIHRALPGCPVERGQGLYARTNAKVS